MGERELWTPGNDQGLNKTLAHSDFCHPMLSQRLMTYALNCALNGRKNKGLSLLKLGRLGTFLRAHDLRRYSRFLQDSRIHSQRIRQPRLPSVRRIGFIDGHVRDTLLICKLSRGPPPNTHWTTNSETAVHAAGSSLQALGDGPRCTAYYRV